MGVGRGLVRARRRVAARAPGDIPDYRARRRVIIPRGGDE